MIDYKLLTIIVVNWNAGLQLKDSIASISKYHSGVLLGVVIVDNASTDDSISQVEALRNLPFELRIVRNTINCGFGAACNQGAALANSEYLLFLNPDTRLYENSIAVPLTFMRRPENADVGVVGIQLVDERNRVARSCARFPSLEIFVARALGLNRLPGLRHMNTHMAEWVHDKTREVDHVIGAFYVIRRSLFETLGGFDERFFVYLEDLDLSLRARQAGWRSAYVADAQAFHAGGGTSRQVKARRLFYSLRSRLLYGFKHFTPAQAWILTFFTLGVEATTRSVYSLLGGGLDGVRNTWNAYGMLWRDIGSILKVRRP